MYGPLYREFAAGDDTLRVYQEGKLVFASDKERLIPLLDYIARSDPLPQQTVIFDKIMGNAAALLAIRAGCREVHSPLGSQLAAGTLDRHGIEHYLAAVVPCIQKPGGEDICPMEKLSEGKEPEEFYEIMKNLARRQASPA